MTSVAVGGLHSAIQYFHNSNKRPSMLKIDHDLTGEKYLEESRNKISSRSRMIALACPRAGLFGTVGRVLVQRLDCRISK